MFAGEKREAFHVSDFALALVRWQRTAGRHDLPWQGTRDPYRVWLSEVMLQQTQVTTVLPYYERFVDRFPDVAALAAAPVDEVMRLWSGLGYYSRARNLHRAACTIVDRLDGVFPASRPALATLPGVGRSTAAAIAALAYGQREAILDGNVKRVLARHFAVDGFPGDGAVEKKLWSLAESLLPQRHLATYTQALMDLGATVCVPRDPRCPACPVRGSCAARRMGRVEDFPAPRPRRPLLLRTTGMLVLVWDTELLLERRPPAGIWGGLWCLPEIGLPPDTSEHAMVSAIARERFACEIERVKRLPTLRHGFTHFTLDIVPVLATVRSRSARAGEADVLWHALADVRDAAVPSPVKRIAQGIVSL